MKNKDRHYSYTIRQISLLISAMRGEYIIENTPQGIYHRGISLVDHIEAPLDYTWEKIAPTG